MEADPKARKLYRSQKIKQYTRKGLCKRARIKCTHVLTIYTGYRVPVRALKPSTYCCWYVTKKQDTKTNIVFQSFSLISMYRHINIVEPITQIYLRRLPLHSALQEYALRRDSNLVYPVISWLGRCVCYVILHTG